MSAGPGTRRSASTSVEVVVLLVAAALLAGYAAMRYGGLWGDSDSYAFAATIRAMVAEAQLIPLERVYSNGYGFPALATFLVNVSGLSVAQLQIAGGALLAVWVVTPAWLAYRELTGSSRGATLATVLVLVQPEFLFPILRGSHEKFTRGLMFLCLFLLVRSVVVRRTWRRFAAFLLVFYLASYALITLNNLFATSFTVALGLALLLSGVLRNSTTSDAETADALRRRLLFVVGISLLLAFLFTFYAYPPSRHGLLVLESVWDRLAMLLLNVEEVATNPYETVGSAWISVPVYLFVSIANWLLLILSFLLWLSQTLTWWRRRVWPAEPRTILLWSLYGAFGFLGALSIVIDLSGAIASNLQHRVFPSFAMVAAAVVADWVIRQQPQRKAVSRIAYGLLASGIAFLGVIAVAKATNEPMVSNKWSYYTPDEFAAMDWSRNNYPEAPTWAAFDERLRAAAGICCNWEAEGAWFDSYQPDPGTRNFLISDVIRARGQRLDLALPIHADSLLVYDNGSSELYHLRPRTPFQK